ncbi:hypothetical protein BC939DRAFT_450670 [Gamsiella multidivaricata]|uniref:uncharacterized protein n=1 Tax=Gamsiella multidivaricata TaxID=101098 RepID=UPI00221F2E98|nr:uncharacterized protein BC939DRAFT_450670 [Gamsiella multidivaricata]KAI7824126.1 hypothetical protein BC939DRAFT_450670 [Gamsiella multidivaricata]
MGREGGGGQVEMQGLPPREKLNKIKVFFMPMVTFFFVLWGSLYLDRNTSCNRPFCGFLFMGNILLQRIWGEEAREGDLRPQKSLVDRALWSQKAGTFFLGLTLAVLHHFAPTTNRNAI